MQKHTYIHNFKITAKLEENFLKEDKASFTQGNAVNLFVVYELDTRSCDLNADFTLKDKKKKKKKKRYYNGSNSFLYANGMKTYQFKAKDSEIKS